MRRAIESLQIRPDEVVVDGNQLPTIDMPAKSNRKGGPACSSHFRSIYSSESNLEIK